MSEMIYMSGPIDFSEGADHWELMQGFLRAMGRAAYSPKHAYKNYDMAMADVFDMCLHVIDNCAMVCCYWPIDRPSVGTPMELIYAVQKGKPIVLIGNSLEMFNKSCALRWIARNAPSFLLVQEFAHLDWVHEETFLGVAMGTCGSAVVVGQDRIQGII